MLLYQEKNMLDNQEEEFTSQFDKKPTQATMIKGMAQ